MPIAEQCDDAAWTVLLRHLAQAQGLPLASACKLLCCSRRMGELVHSVVQGSLQAPQQTERQAALGCWLAKHAVLLHSLHATLAQGDEGSVAAGLLTAAQQSDSRLPLASFSCSSPSDGRLLLALAGLHLTLLVLHPRLEDSAGPSQQQYCAALASLTRLQRLTLAGAWCGKCCMPVLGPALKQLTLLTQLSLPRVEVDAASMQQLPTSVRELTLCCHQSPLQLQHLTELRSLHCQHQLHADETLPPSLTALWLGRCESVAPLLALPNLQRLRVDYDLTAEQLHSLARLPQLQALLLSYFCCRQGKACDHGTLACAVDQLSKVPLTDLKVLGQWGAGCGHLAAAVADQLGTLTQLTSLSLQDLVVQLTPGQFAAQLQLLPRLQRLELRCLRFDGTEESDDGSMTERRGLRGVEGQPAQGCQRGTNEDWGALARALTGLSSLRELCWLGMPDCCIAGAVAAQLQAATQLTRLTVGEPSADEVAVTFKACCGVN